MCRKNIESKRKRDHCSRTQSSGESNSASTIKNEFIAIKTIVKYYMAKTDSLY